MPRLRSRCFFPVLVVAALLGTVHTILPCALLLLPLPLAPLRRAYRAAVCFVAWAWFTLAASLLEAESAVRVTGDAPPASDRTVLLVCNHNSRVDWMYVWVLAARFGVAERLKIALKDSLRRAPIFGWAMQAFLFVFLSRRDRDADLGTLRSVLSYCAHGLREPTAFLLFPEGTDLSASNLEKSREWAAKRGVAPFDHLLLPREAGCEHATDTDTDTGTDTHRHTTPHHTTPHHTHARAHARTHARTHTRTHAHARTRARTYVRTHTRTRTRVLVLVCACAYFCTCARPRSVRDMLAVA